jgi:hypothetical protein
MVDAPPKKLVFSSFNANYLRESSYYILGGVRYWAEEGQKD